MATDFTQDTVLHYLQGSGGSAKNSDLLLHFRNFLQDHVDRARNRELFKKFVNSVATVKQVDGVSHVVLRKKFKGHVPGGGDGRSSGPPPLPAGRNNERSPQNATLSAAGGAEKPRQKPQLREVTTPALPGVTAGKAVLPAAGIMNNNNNNNNNNNSAETNLNLKQRQVTSTPEVSGRPAAQAGSQISEETELELPSQSEPPARDQRTKVGQQWVGSGPPPGNTPVVAAVRQHGETGRQVSVLETLREREACLPLEGGLHQGPPLHHVSRPPQVAQRRVRHRQSYKSAVSYDEDEEDDEEEVPLRRGSAGGAWPLSVPLGDMGRAISSSSPCIIDPPAPPYVIDSSSSSSSSSEKKLPKIYIQDVEGGTLTPGGPGWNLESGVGLGRQRAGPGQESGSSPGESTSTRRSLPLESELYMPSPDRATGAVPRRDVHADPRYSQSAGVQLEPRQSQREWLSSSHSSIFSPSSDTGLSSRDRPPSGSSRGSGWNSTYEDLQARTDKTRGGSKIQEVLQRSQRTESVTHRADSQTTAPWHHSTGHLRDDEEPTAHLSPFRHSADHLRDDQGSTAPVSPWHLSTGDLYDDHEGTESSEGSCSSPRQRPAVARRLSRQLRSRMCRSLGADLDQLLREEARGSGGSEAARLNRLHMISSSLSLRYDLSSSSLSSCSTPPRCHSLADLVEGEEERGGRRSLPAAAASATSSPSTAHHEGPSRQSLVPLEPREHAWLVKGAAGAWPDIYSLFREDSSLLNRQDFISGFTVLHWIAKHGDHRVLNTLWYGVQKAGLTFDVNARSTCGHTPLHIAAIHGNKNIMQLLVNKFSADVRLRDTAGKKPWQYLSSAAPPDIFHLLGAQPRAAGGGQGGVVRADPGWKQQQQQQQQQPPRRRRRRHHLSFASSGDRPLTISGTARVKRSSSIAAFLKHKSMQRFHGHQSDSSI
ncbi:ankyrin repeat domain-containing protein SOWAHB-like [Enoplosus armatus]|uniref:ankyrin repeat domain-containing protein SOWAHB-like n=1 Tax=Enoplosus armatus TaxID=215367 RepID=UPI0039919FCA